MFTVLFRTIILYILLVISMRFMGKRQIGELQPFELVITLMISELASLPMADTKIPLLHGVIPIITLLVLQIFLSLLQLKSKKSRSFLSGDPSILIEDGKVNISQLRNQRLNIDDLMEELRLKGYYNINDIEYAILETSGQLSIIPKTKLTPATKEDLKISTIQEKAPISLILDGEIQYKNLQELNKDITWLMKKLEYHNISSYKDVFIAIIDSKNKFYYQCKDNIS